MRASLDASWSWHGWCIPEHAERTKKRFTLHRSRPGAEMRAPAKRVPIRYISNSASPCNCYYDNERHSYLTSPSGTDRRAWRAPHTGWSRGRTMGPVGSLSDRTASGRHAVAVDPAVRPAPDTDPHTFRSKSGIRGTEFYFRRHAGRNAAGDGRLSCCPAMGSGCLVRSVNSARFSRCGSKRGGG
jgi:hypothetical protein